MGGAIGDGEGRLDFDIPDTVVPVAVDLNSGRPVNPASSGAFIEYFKSGTEPLWSGSSEQEGLDTPEE